MDESFMSDSDFDTLRLCLIIPVLTAKLNGRRNVERSNRRRFQQAISNELQLIRPAYKADSLWDRLAQHL